MIYFGAIGDVCPRAQSIIASCHESSALATEVITSVYHVRHRCYFRLYYTDLIQVGRVSAIFVLPQP